MLCWSAFFTCLSLFTCGSIAAEPVSPNKDAEEFRNFSATAPAHVQDFYRANHAEQSFEFVLQKQQEYLPPRRCSLKVWEVVELLGNIVDESDPDLHLPQSYHSYQTAEALRRDGYPRWLILVGFIHDLGKILAYYGEPQWAVVGDTFPVGCAYSPKVVFPEFFAANPDRTVPLYQTECGIYAPGCGFEHLQMSWGHDEYLYQVIKNFVPPEASYIIRFHSFYAAHRDGAYTHLMNARDRHMLPWLQLFSRYDLYSKHEEAFDINALKSYYQALVAEFFPDPIDW